MNRTHPTTARWNEPPDDVQEQVFLS